MSRRRRSPYRGPDRRTRAAKAAGYPARSVFKLSEIDRRLKLLRRGSKVLDLGAAPGSWSIYVAERIGREGRLLAVDLQPLRTELPPPHQVIQGDALALPKEQVAVFAPYDVVLSDMAPATCGDRGTDQWRSYELFRAALERATELLSLGGSFVGKLFMGAEFTEARQAVRDRFETVRTIRPESTRATSFEIFIAGIGAHKQ